ncbi:MAG: hypothetical protein AABX51_06795, partial [Nanoarchaeota archaeon]
NGAPQQGVCGRETDTCGICPDCNVNVQCSEEIGGLFREMFVECSGGDEGGFPKTYPEFINSIAGGKAASLNNNLNDQMKGALGSNMWQMFVKHPDRTDWIWFQTQDGLVIAAGRGLAILPPSTMSIELSVQIFERILQSPTPASEVMTGIKSGEIKIQTTGIINRFGLGLVRLFGPAGNQPAVPPASITDNSGTNTACNSKWDGPKQITCSGNVQSPGTGLGQNCCEQSCGADSQCDEQGPGTGLCTSACKYQNVIPAPPLNFNRFNLALKPDASIGQYPGSYACEFYQSTPLDYPVRATKKLVSCNIAGLGDAFCITAFGGDYRAKAIKCEENGMVVCTLPCAINPPPRFCAFDINRPRGANAPPISFCPPIVSGGVAQQKKDVGATCNHGGECTTGNCVGVGMGPPWTYQCSCNPFRMEYAPCK